MSPELIIVEQLPTSQRRDSRVLPLREIDMVLIVKILIEELVKADKRFLRDPRTSHFPLVGSPWPMVVTISLYLVVVKRWGPRLMAQRQPFNVKLPMQIYNMLQVILNLYVFYGSLRYSYMQPHFKFSCQEYNVYDARPSNMNLRYAAYVYYISKYLDFTDTLFFVLRKKNNQISFLHVYHHSIMVFGVWAYVTLLFASHYTATGVVNSLVHICMYTYYFVAALDHKIDLTAWKRRLTQLQIVQFLYLVIHFARPVFNNWCGLDMFWVWVSFTQNLFMLALFSDFYYKAYMTKGRTSENNRNRLNAAGNKAEKAF